MSDSEYKGGLLVYSAKQYEWLVLTCNEVVPNPKDNIDRNDNEKDDEKLTDVLPGEDDPVDCEERELEVKDDWPSAEFEK